jgi:hypothetical protein
MSDEQNASFAQSSLYRHRKLFILSTALICTAILSFFFARNLIDFPVYYAAGRSLLSGRTDLYSPTFALGRVMDYRYPPFFLLALLPFWLFPYPIAAYVWTLLGAVSIILCAAIIGRTFHASRTMWLLAALAAAQYLVMALHYGNAQLLVVFLAFASFYSFLRGRDTVSGGLMALAITIKLTPILLLPYFAVKKRWSMLASTIVFLLVINVTPSLYFGFRQNGELLKTWYNHVVASQEFHEDNGPINLSLKGQLRRYLSSVDYSARVDGDVNYPAVNVASQSRDFVTAVWAVVAGLVSIGVLVLIWRGGDSLARRTPKADVLTMSGNELMSLEMSVMLCLILFVGPLTSKIYFIALLWPLASMSELSTDRGSRRGAVLRYVLLFLAVANCVLPLLPGRSIQRLLLVLGADFCLNCLLLICLLYVLISRDRLLRIQSDEPQTPVLSAARKP